MAAKGDKVIRKPIETLDINYRLTDALNYSAIKLFEKSPVEFYEQVVLKLPKDDEDTGATLLGNIVDDAILTHQGNIEEFEQHFSDRYALYEGEASTAQAFLLAEELYRITVRCLDEEGKPTREFQDRFTEAFGILQEQGKYKGKTVEQGVADFEKPNKSGYSAVDYFKKKLDNIGKMVVSVGIKAKGLLLSSNALTDPFTANYFSFSENDENIEKLTKFPITFNYKCEEGEIEGKIEVDELIINHLEKTIQPLDLKTTYDNTQFPYNYLKNRYYIQAVWYSIGVVAWAQANNMGDYTVLPYKFIVLDTSNNNRRPLIYALNETHLNDGYEGFMVGSHKYKGVAALVSAIIWANSNSIWNIEKEAYLNNGELKMEAFA